MRGAAEAEEALGQSVGVEAERLDPGDPGGGKAGDDETFEVEVRKIGGLSEPSDSAGSKPWPIINVDASSL